MENTPAVINPAQAALAETGFTTAQLDILRNVVCRDATDDELLFFAQVCRAKKMDPFGQQIFLVKRKGKNGDQLAIQTGIDGFRAQAARTGDYAGNDEPEFTYDGDKRPCAAKATVYRMVQGVRVAFSATARWDEFYPGDAMGFMWKSKPHVMLGKCAEAQALRKAFPNECGGMYEQAELDAPAEPKQAQVVQTAATLNARFAAKPATPQATLAEPAPVERIEKMLIAFQAVGVTAAEVAAYLGVGEDYHPTNGDLDKLMAWYGQKKGEKANG